jgi:predicted  nucleic acid-binding Zn-ribbon protein
MNRRFVGPFLAVTLLMIPGCGPDLQKENEALKSEIKTVREENTSLKEKVQTLENERNTLTTNIESVQKQLAEKEQALEAAKKAARPQLTPKRK